MSGSKPAWESFARESLAEESDDEDERMMKMMFPVRRDNNDRSACIVSTGSKSLNHGQQLASASSDKPLSSAVEPSSRWATSASPIDISAVEEDNAADFTDTPWTIARRLALLNKAKTTEKPNSPHLTLDLRAAVQELGGKKCPKSNKGGLQTSLKSAFAAQKRAQIAAKRQSGYDRLQSPSGSGEPTTSGKICYSNDTPASAFPGTVPLVGPSDLNVHQASIDSEARYAQQDYYRGSIPEDTAQFDVEPGPDTDRQSCVEERTGHELSEVQEEDTGERWASVQTSSDYLFQHSASPPPTTDAVYYHTGYEDMSPMKPLGNICGSMGVTSSMSENIRRASERNLDSEIDERYPAFEFEENRSAYGSESYDSRPAGMMGAPEWEESEQDFASKADADHRYLDRAFGPIDQEMWEAHSYDHIPGSERFDDRPAWSLNDRFNLPPRTNPPDLVPRAATFTPFPVNQRRKRVAGASKVGSLSEYAKRCPTRAPAYARGSARIKNPPEVFHFKADKRKAQEVLHETIIKAKHSRSQQAAPSFHPSTPTDLDEHDHLPPLKRPTLTALYEPTATLHEFKMSSSCHADEEIQSPAVRSRAVRPALAVLSSGKKRPADVTKRLVEQRAKHLVDREPSSESKELGPQRQTVVTKPKVIVKLDLQAMTIERCHRLRRLLETQLSGPGWPPELVACIDQRLSPDYIDLCSTPE